MKATILSRDIPQGSGITCPDCGGINKPDAYNTPCDLCGYILKVHLFPKRENYVRGIGTTASGGDTYDINDLTACDLRGLNTDEMFKKTAQLLHGVPKEYVLKSAAFKEFGDKEFTVANISKHLRTRYGRHNAGMQRMDCGNVLRAARDRQDKAVNGTK